MPTIQCDPATARDRLVDAGVEIRPGNTEHERWRAERGDAVAVAYDDKVVVQGASPTDLTLLLKDGGGRGHVYFDGASRGNPGPAATPATDRGPAQGHGSAAGCDGVTGIREAFPAASRTPP